MKVSIIRGLALALCAALVTGCASSGLKIERQHVALGQDSRVQYIVVHYTSTDLPRSLEILTREQVSSHYLIGESPATIYQLVDEDRRAWHAGDSQWQGRTWLNSSTIGIELVNQGYLEDAQGVRRWLPYKDEQIDALIVLLKDIMQRHGLKPGAVIGHSDIAPQRKVDPGPLFPWKRLADAGLLPWPDAAEVEVLRGQYVGSLPSVAWFQDALAGVGYSVPRHGLLDEQTRNVIAAFQMKYRQSLYDGEPDAQTAALLAVVSGNRP